ncbi:hypothetical protein GCM10012275_16990 [Longimycelium tulufanense]|uniref:Uncharacterized protein n=1 Tax=Longimycelium tulufanense TaxID=907463 RepID=A0A8J3C739_9PSEU|nr:hypothetical protein GCM10012275_16990 [Longimycelium tulufanense]
MDTVEVDPAQGGERILVRQRERVHLGAGQRAGKADEPEFEGAHRGRLRAGRHTVPGTDVARRTRTRRARSRAILRSHSSASAGVKSCHTRKSIASASVVDQWR